MYAGLWLRLKAFALDYVLIFSDMGVLFIVSVIFIPSIQQGFQASRIIAQLTGFILLTLPVSLCFIVADSKMGKQSFGKYKMGIVVTD
ncbi:RDD family protein [Planococcus kocurii]|uniref:RDD domain-containing protein n=1 Tax=Planococcus kocurii TaxID=1374 RepID=A0ABM5WXM5_9BACL|nr:MULTISPECIES: RDD family protein [Planococcus]ALS79087.1 hypothetical protein AUO94_10625 [Planococcus kocurii]KAA0957952.1 hypothetical protein FQ085_07845 [Planococcus sp. ANT_H30]